MPNYAELLSVVENETDKAVLLSGSSIALLFSTLGEYLEHAQNWVGSADFGVLTDEEKDNVDALIALAERELMTEVSTQAQTGIVFMSPADRTGALFCDGAQYARVDYPDLYDFLAGTSYIVDADNFTVPDLVDTFVMGGETPGGTGGEASHTLTEDELPTHTHTVQTGTGSGQAGSGIFIAGTTTERARYVGHEQVVTTNFDNNPHNNMPPYHKMRFYIWT